LAGREMTYSLTESKRTVLQQQCSALGYRPKRHPRQQHGQCERYNLILAADHRTSEICVAVDAAQYTETVPFD
jgi:hypothetical protein